VSNARARTPGGSARSRMCGWRDFARFGGTYAAHVPEVARRYPIGAELAEGGVHFRVWAPAAKRLAVVIEGAVREHPLEREASGYFSGHVRGLAAGARYRFRIDDRRDLYADPASRFQPDGPFGASQIVDPHDRAWTDSHWRGVTAPDKQVIYELHVGTFTRAGTYAAAGEHLRFLADLGITTLEMMPVNDYAGRHGWGYDGVDLFAPSRNYGTPADLRAFIDRAHGLGLAVLLDVVYNHLGPAGNFLFEYAPQFRQQGGANEWGDALDYAQPGVREFFTANAAYWIDEFHFDGLRIDATQAISDPSLLDEIARRSRAAAGTRKIFIVGENEPQDAAMITEHGLDALWNDDFHHTARVALTGSTDGYLHDYRGTPQELLSGVKHGFLYQGQLYGWQRNVRGTPTRGIAKSAFVHFLENHDQVANLGFGDRLVTTVDAGKLRALTALLLLSPEIPMLFQGQETGSRAPWRFFCDHDPELSKLVREGRAAFLRQFARLATTEAQAALPDPTTVATFNACVLDERERHHDNPWVRLHHDLIVLRRTISFDELDGAVLGPEAFCLRWPERLLFINLGKCLRDNVLPEPLLAPPLHQGWRAIWSSEDPRYGGMGTPEPFSATRLAIPAHAAVLCASDPAAYLRQDPPPVSGEKQPVEP
jgi:maltooligosyltrehalose trehalohydrolase